MKTRIISMMAVALMFIGGTSLLAQPGAQGEGKGKNHEEGAKAGLTEDQKTKIKDLRMAAYKEIKPLENQLGELEAKEHTLTTADKPDMNAINANIDEIAKVKVKIAKVEIANRMQIRSLLTDEQKMWFDKHPKFKKEKGERHFGMMMNEKRGGEMQQGKMHHGEKPEFKSENKEHETM
jgi:Spy/CpxP family protein refolding chaperone